MKTAPTSDGIEQATPTTTVIRGCSNHGCMIVWPPRLKGSVGTNATCRCVHNLVRDGKWLDLVRAITVRNIEIENLTIQLGAVLKEHQDNCND